MLLLALGLGWLWGFPPFAGIRFDLLGFSIGLLATVPLFVVLWISLGLDWKPLAELRQLVRELLGPHLVDCKWLDVVLISLSAGIAEEALFRGVLQSAMLPYLGAPLAVLIASVLFGLVHAVSKTYAIAATLIGLFLGLLYLATGNILTAIVCHAVYDIGALAFLIKDARAAGISSTDTAKLEPDSSG